MFLKGIVYEESEGELEMKKFAQRLKELREYYDMTQAEVAECLNFSSAAICNYECGIREPGIEELILLAELFHVSMDYLVGRIDYPSQSSKKKIIRYVVTDTLKIPNSLDEKEIDLIVHTITNGKKCSWYEAK